MRKMSIWASALVLCLLFEGLVTPAFAAGYRDVSDDAWYADAVGYMKEHGYMIGTSEDTFSPDGAFSRAQMATVLYRLAGEPSVTGEDIFTDTQSGTWYSDAVLWAAQNRIMNGYGGGLFGTNDPVTQEQLVTLLWRRAGEPEVQGSDEQGVSVWAAKAVRWARETIIDENGYTFVPGEPSSRALVAVLTMRFDMLRSDTEPQTAKELVLRINDVPVAVTWEDNASVDALKELVRENPLTVRMSRYGGFEQVGSLGSRLPSSDVQTTTTPGDIVLYSSNQIVIFYGSNSWAYTRLGHITDQDAAGMTDLFGNGDVTITISME